MKVHENHTIEHVVFGAEHRARTIWSSVIDVFLKFLFAATACLHALFIFSPPTTLTELSRNLVIPDGLVALQAAAKLSLTHTGIAIG